MVENGQRDDVGRFKTGHRGGPGRPRYGVTDALRRLVDPDQIARVLVELATDPEVCTRDRLAACAQILDRLEGKPLARALVARADLPALPPLDHLGTPEQRVHALQRWREDLLAARALESTTVMLDVEAA